ncbi:MAG: flagellar hook-length control protein FliK [Sterolibacterium sp.]|nr:flagellar hook-length control protein FliK [Sterolibacterium sp.]
MVLIPPDIGLRLRQQTELLPQPIAPLREIPADLPALKTGQLFSALIQEALPENTYRALVAGRSVTLSLPEAVKSGDVLDLVVIDRTPKTIVAQLAKAGAGAAEAADQAAYPYATFSRAAKMISSLLVTDGETPPAVELNRGQPLLAQPPRSGAELVPALNKAVTESGLFYEAHQAQWVAGKLPLANVLQEPQGQHSLPQAQIAALSASQAGSATAAEETPNKQEAGTALFLANRQAAGREEGAETMRTQANSPTSLLQTAASMPEEIRPLVQQQLDAAGMQRLLWHGEVWPGQTVDWKVEWEGQRNNESNSNQSESAAWTTQLRLTTPRLGELEATMRLGPAGVHITLSVAEVDSARDLRNGAQKLDQALATAGIPLLGLSVRQAQEE